MIETRKRKNNNNWQGGKHKSSHGYIKTLVGIKHHLSDSKGYAYEHQVVAEKMLGRKLKAKEVVHHKNGDKQDNRESNIEVCPDIKHHRYLHRTRKNNLQNPWEKNVRVKCECGCGKSFWKYDKQGRLRRFLPSHNAKLQSKKLCDCGCGESVARKTKFKLGHKSNKFGFNKADQPKLIECNCGCGEELNKFDRYGRPREFVSGHNMKRVMQ